MSFTEFKTEIKYSFVAHVSSVLLCLSFSVDYCYTVILPMCTIFCHALKILTLLIFLIAINSLTR